MKKFIVTGLTLVCVVLGGCNNKNCGSINNYNSYGMYYDEISKECKCINEPKQEITFSSDNVYSVREITKPLEYYVQNERDYPFFSHQGDTLNICGWLMSSDTVFELLATREIAIGGVTHSIKLKNVVNTIGVDFDDTCYVRGILEFSHSMIKNNDNQCFVPDYYINVINISNNHY